MFFVFEGLDGSGSTTQAKLLASIFQEKGYDVLHTSEPTDNLVGGLIRGVLTHQWDTSPEGLQMLFCADRAHHLQFQIEPALAAGKIVICDRYVWSTVAYGSLHCETAWLQDMNRHFRIPDFTFLLQLDPKTCLKRIKKRGSTEELFEKEQTLEKVWKTYEQLSRDTQNTQILDGQLPMDTLAENVIEILQKKFPEKFFHT